MAKKKTVNPRWEIKSRKIFAIVFEKTQSVYVGKTTMKRMYQVYDFHYNEKFSATKIRFQEYKKCNELPKMFLLGEISGTDADAFNYCIAWSKYFLERGFDLEKGVKMKELASDFGPETNEIYKEINDIPISEICAEEKNLFPNYGKVEKKREENRSRPEDQFRIDFGLSKEDYDFIKTRSNENGISMKDYVLTCAKYGKVEILNTEFIEKYLHMLTQYSTTLNGIVSTILLTRDYYPADLERMYEISQEVMKNNDSLKGEIILLCREIRKNNSW